MLENQEIDKKVKKNKEDVFANIQVLDTPTRKVSKVIEDALKNNIPVRLSKDGYYIGGFYGLNANTDNHGFAFAQDTSEDNSLALFDSKGHKHLIKNFEDLVKFNNHVWSLFYKVSEDYKRPDILWFTFMLQYGVLNILPGSNK